MPKSVRERLKESETRNKTLVEYIDIIEAQCAGVLRIASEQYDKMNLIFTPGSKQAKSVFADICRAMVPIVQDVEDMKLSPEMVKAVLGRGGLMIHQEGVKKVDEKSSKLDGYKPDGGD